MCLEASSTNKLLWIFFLKIYYGSNTRKSAKTVLYAPFADIGRLQLEKLLGPLKCVAIMDNYTMLNVANPYPRQNNPITIYVTYYDVIISNVYISWIA